MRRLLNGYYGKVTVVLIVFLMILSIGTSRVQSAEPVDKVEVLVGFNDMSAREQNRGLVRAFGGEIYAEFGIVDVIAARMTPQQASALARNPRVSYIEPDSEVHALAQDVPWGIDRVFGAEDYSFGTWDSSRGAGIGVAVLDTGVDMDHEDLEVVGGRRFYLRGLTLRSDDQYNDVNGHGTHVAGTIAALDNGIGVVGVAPEAKLYAVKVLGDNGSGSVSAIVAGIEWVYNRSDISIINMSLGSSTYSATFENACNRAYSEGILIVSSAGNSGNTEGTGDTVGYPAKYASVVAVAASDINDGRAYFSSTGLDVELIAPGMNIKSTVPDSKYEDGWSGTSMASPHVAGAAALVWGTDPTMTNEEVRGILADTAGDLGLPTEHQGNGLVRADLAVGDDGPVTPVTYTLTIGPSVGGTTDPLEGEYDYESGDEVTLTATANPDYKFDRWVIDGNAVYDSETSITMSKDIRADAYFSLIPDEPGIEPIIEVSTDKVDYSGNTWVYITAKVLDPTNPMPGETVNVVVAPPSGSITSYTGMTDPSGQVVFKYRLLKTSPKGTYNVDASINWEGTTIVDQTFFTVK
ncbi:MAG: S8 family serine peptidase [Gudongella sp.]|nr:S8 family serine peptidase [Gudongella sp.]